MSSIDLKAFRKANRLSQAKLAEYLGVGQGFISQIEAGERPLPMNLLDKILGNKDWNTTGIVPERPSDSELVSALRETIEAQKQTIEYQKEIISMLKAQKGIQSKPVKESASSASSHTGV